MWRVIWSGAGEIGDGAMEAVKAGKRSAVGLLRLQARFLAKLPLGAGSNALKGTL
jgi:hypothetical protein